MFFTYFTVLQCGVKKFGGERGVQQCHVSSQMKARHPPHLPQQGARRCSFW